MNPDQIQKFIHAFLHNLELSDEGLDYIADKYRVIKVKSKQNLIIPGEVCSHIYLVLDGGFVCRYVHEQTGAANTINFYLPDLHPVMACIDSYFTQTPTHCELKAIRDSHVIALPKIAVDHLIGLDAAFAKYHQEVISTAMTEENEVKTKLIAFSSKEKYDFILREMPSVIQHVPSKYIAEFCGISPEWLSKLKKQA